MEAFNEQEFFDKVKAQGKQDFLNLIKNYEMEVTPIMLEAGYKRINQAERTVLFSFGEVTFARSRWKKGEEVRIPVDEKLGLIPYTRFSRSIMAKLAELATMLPYRKAAETVHLLTQDVVTKDSVYKAVKQARELLETQELVEVPDKIKADMLYIDGDGVWVKRHDPEKNHKSVELSHFIIHTGSYVISQSRRQLMDKHEVIAINHEVARERLLDLLYTRFDITKDTIIITNSDGGSGYGPETFNELLAPFKFKAHYHFWDAYHVNQHIKNAFSPYPPALTQLVYTAIKNQDKQQLTMAFDTAESLAENQRQLEQLNIFRCQLLKNLAYAKSPKARGLEGYGIGVIESNHRKITYRMKHRGMYWSEAGAEIMSRLILLREQPQAIIQLFAK